MRFNRIVTVRLTRELTSALKQCAEENQLGESAIIRLALHQFLDTDAENEQRQLTLVPIRLANARRLNSQQ